MKENTINTLINKFSLVLNLIYKTRIPTKRVYAWYHRLIVSILLDDLKQAESEMLKVQLTKEHLENKVWVMWWQGLDNAPSLVVNNVERMYRIFGKDRVIVVTKDNFEKYTNIPDHVYDKLKDKSISFTLWSDIVRYNLLLNNGGLWIDSTVVLSNLIKKYLEQLGKLPFISLCNIQNDYRYISDNKWVGWFIGGERNYDLFRFVVSFFNVYFSNHRSQMDYFIVDDAVYFFYKGNEKFRDIVNKQLTSWDPYLFLKKYKSTEIEDILNAFDNKREYSVQKFSYKIKCNSKTSLYTYLNTPD